VRFSQALGFEGFPELQAAAREEYRRVNAKAAQETGAPSSTPLFSLDQNEFESALVADYMNVEETARKVSRSSVEALIEAIVSADKVLVAGTDQMLSSPATCATCSCSWTCTSTRGKPIAGGAEQARANRRLDARDRALRRAPAPASSSGR